MPTPPLPQVSLNFLSVFGGNENTTDEIFFSEAEWKHPVSFFVGRNGTGKSRTAKIITNHVGGTRLSTERLSSLTKYDSWGWTSAPAESGYRGLPLGDKERNSAENIARSSGTGIDNMFALKDEPEVWLQVAAFVRRALGRSIVMKEESGYLDLFIRRGNIEYSLFRDEGHGLRELIILLTAIYREDWQLLVIDEPELHLHPSMVRLWLGELERICSRDDRRAIVVTHEPNLVRPRTAEQLESIYLFSAGKPVIKISDATKQAPEKQITASLQHNPALISQLVFAPRPVLVEGIHDIAALTVSLERTHPPEVTAQTDFIDCGGDGRVALWYEISHNLGIDVRAIGDLDACLEPSVQRVMNRSVEVQEQYRTRLYAEPPTTATVIRPLLAAMKEDGVEASPKTRAIWLSNPPPQTGHASRVKELIAIWRDAGFWLHPQGTLESVLGIIEKGKGNAQLAAETPGPIDDVADWCAYELDTLGDIEELLGVAVEAIAHSIMRAERETPGAEFKFPIGGENGRDARLVNVEPLGNGRHRLTVQRPESFAGYSVEFSRDTPTRDLTLSPPHVATPSH